MKVRTKACGILGSFDGIDSKYLMQTLSKQIMSNLKIKAGAPDMDKEGQGFQPGNRRAFFSPEGDTEISQEELSLLETGACGAFVHGLEDEFQEVREAATSNECPCSPLILVVFLFFNELFPLPCPESICELALKSDEFAAACIDSLVGQLTSLVFLSWACSMTFPLHSTNPQTCSTTRSTRLELPPSSLC